MKCQDQWCIFRAFVSLEEAADSVPIVCQELSPPTASLQPKSSLYVQSVGHNPHFNYRCKQHLRLQAIKKKTNTKINISSRLSNTYTRATPEVMPVTLLHWPTTSEGDAGGMARRLNLPTSILLCVAM